MDYHVVTALIEPPRQNSSRFVNQEPVYFKSGGKGQWVLFCHPYKGRGTCKPSTRRQERSDTVAIDIPEILTLLSDDQKLARCSRTRTRKIGGEILD